MSNGIPKTSTFDDTPDTPADSAPVFRPAVTQIAIEKLQEAILSGRYKPRQRLVERELEEDLGISRTPIREALRELEYAGLVRIVPKRGAEVRDFNVTEVFNLYVVRLPLEKLAITLMTDVQDDDVAQLSAIQDELEHSFQEFDFPTMVMLNHKFHEAFIGITRNEWLQDMLKHLHKKTYLLVQHGPYAERDGLRISMRDHREMIALLQSRRHQELCALTFRHILRSAGLYLRRAALVSGTGAEWEERLETLASEILRQPMIKVSPIVAGVVPGHTGRGSGVDGGSKGTSR